MAYGLRGIPVGIVQHQQQHSGLSAVVSTLKAVQASQGWEAV